MNAEQSQLPSGRRRTSRVRSACRDQVPESVVGPPIDTRRGAVITTRKSLFRKEKLGNVIAVRRVCAGLVALVAALGVTLPAFAEPVESTDRAVILRTAHAPRNLSAIAEGPRRVALSWQAPLASDASRVTGYGIQFSDDGGANWSVLPTAGRRATSFVHSVGLSPKATLQYRVFAIGTDGAGPAAVVRAVTPATSMPRILDVKLSTDQGSHRWYPPRREVAVTVQFDQAVTVNTNYGTPRIGLVMGRPPLRQSGYASDYSGGSGTDRLTFRYTTVDWHQDVSDIEVGPDALHLNGGRIVNFSATHRALLAHGPATLDRVPQVDTRSDAVLVMDTPAAPAPAPAPASAEADRQIARSEQSNHPAFAAMLTAVGALVAGTEFAQQLALTDGRKKLERASVEPRSDTSGPGGDDSLAAVAVDLGEGVGPRAAATPSKVTLGFFPVTGQTRITFFWSGIEEGRTADDYLIEYSNDAGSTWANLLGYDDQGHDIYRPASEGRQYQDTGLAPGTTRTYRVTARNSDGRGETSNVLSVTTKQMVSVPACDSAFWSTEIIVGHHSGPGYWGFQKEAGTNDFGEIDDAEFSFGGTTHIVRSAYFDRTTQYDQQNYGWLPDYHFSVSPGFPTDRWDDLTLHVGQVQLSFANVSSHSQQSTWYGYVWASAQYAGTFDYEVGDWVTVCLVDASPGVTLALDPASISENNESSTVTATVANASSTPFTVTVSAEPDSPAVDGDFTLSTNKVLSFTANATESTGIVTITANDNSVDAPDKTITVKGELSSGAELRAPEDVTLTITDDDAEPELSLSVSPATIAEDGGAATITVSTTGTATFAQNQTISLTFAGTATKGDDYIVSSETLTLSSGERSVTSTVTAIDDSVDESDETVLVTATHDGATVGAQQQVTIADTLAAVLGTHSPSVKEGDDATFVVDLSGGTSTADVEVNYALDTSSTASSGTDYTAPSGKLTLAGGESSGTITITTLTDQVLDPGETLIVKLASATTDTRTVTVDDTAKKTATIQEEDTRTVSVGPVLVADDAGTQDVDESDDKSAVEEGETASFVVTLSGEVSGTVSVPYTTANGTAESGTGKDYTTASGTLEFTTGQTSKTIDVTTLEDSFNEADETYTLTLTSVSGVTGVSLGTASATGTIADDDALTAALGTHTANVAEGGAATFEVELSGGTSTAEVEVTFAVDGDSTATSGSDYTAPASWKLTLAAGESSGTITIATLDNDGVLDPGETLVVKLTSATTDTRTVTVDATATKTATIQEENTRTVSVGPVLVADDAGTQDVDESDDKSAVEEGETASFVVTLSGEVSGTVSVPYTTANGTAESGTGKDYTTASGTLEFTTGQTSKTIDVTTLEDSFNEASETYTLTLTSVSGVTGVSLGTASATGTIADDDALTAALGTHTANVAEGGAATFEVELSGGTSTAEVEVTFAVDGDSTAASGTDYTAPASWKLTLAAGESSGTITITTLTDQVLDPGETLIVKLTSASTDTRTVTVDATTKKTATIREEDTRTVSVGPVLVADDDQTPEDESDDKSAVEEGETASFVVTLSGEVSGTVSVPYTTANGTAESGTGKDYTTASGTLEFTTGQTSKTIDVTTLEDSLNEADETYTLTLTSVSGVTGVSLGTASATGTIADDDALTAALGTHTANVAEGGAATFEVELSGGTSTAEVEVTFAVDGDSTATSGSDYTAPASWKLTLAAGESSGTITIATLDNDGVLDPGETLVVKLTSATTDTRTVTVDATTKKTATIREEDTRTVSVGPVLVADDDQTPEDETDDKSAVEEGETASFVVTLSGEVSGTVSVPYTTADGTAESGTGKDYTTASGTLEFTTGQTSKTIEVTTLEDSFNEASETYTLTLTSVSGVDGSESWDGERDGNDRGRRRVDGGAGHAHGERGGRRRCDVRGGPERRHEHGGSGGDLRGGRRLDGDIGNGLHGAGELEADASGGREQRNDHDSDAGQRRGAGPRRDADSEAGLRNHGHAHGDGGRHGEEDGDDPGRGHTYGVGGTCAGGRRRRHAGRGRVGRQVGGRGRRDGELRGDAERRGVGDGERAVHDGERHGGVWNGEGLHDGERHAGVHDRTDQQDDRGDDAGGQLQRG